MIGDDLRQRGARALALRRGAGRDRDLAVRHDADGDAFERAEPGAFDVIADADAEIAAARAGLGLAGAGLLILRRLDRTALAQRKIAADIDPRLCRPGSAPRVA